MFGPYYDYLVNLDKILGDNMVINIKHRDSFGRVGVLDINGVKINTPNYLPNQKDIDSLIKSPFVDKSNFPDIDISVYVHWLDKQEIDSISKSVNKYDEAKKDLVSKLKNCNIIGTKQNLIHFKFKKDVDPLSEKQIHVLLDLQNDVGANIIEIPNVCYKSEYENILNKAKEWRLSKGINKELMGIANEWYDVITLKNKINLVNCVGIDFKNENRPLLSAIKVNLKPLDIWMHAFSVPRSFKTVKWDGSLSVLLNDYGIDTISMKVGQPKNSQRYIIKMKEMTKEQKIQENMKLRYFNPADYSTFRISEILSDKNLSNSCNCPVCRGNSTKTILDDIDTAYINLRSHEVFAYINESSNYQKEITNRTSDKYFNSKKYAKEIAYRLGV